MNIWVVSKSIKISPSKEKFYSLLTDKNTGIKIMRTSWDRFGIDLKWNNIRLLQLALKICCFILADAFEKFRNSSLRNHALCPSHYLRAPALSWDAILNMKQVKFELILDVDMYLFFEKGMRAWFFTFLKYIVKPTLIIWNLMTQSKSQNIFYRLE